MQSQWNNLEKKNNALAERERAEELESAKSDVNNVLVKDVDRLLGKQRRSPTKIIIRIVFHPEKESKKIQKLLNYL